MKSNHHLGINIFILNIGLFKMKIFFSHKPVSIPYGGGNQFVLNLSNYLIKQGHQVIYNLQEGIDIIFVIDGRKISNYTDYINYKKKNPKTKIILRVNECDKRKNTNIVDNLILYSIRYSDKICFVSEWLAKYFISRGFDKKKPYKSIYSGCNNTFYPVKDNKIDTTNIKIVTHHHSTHWSKGYDIYSQLDKLIDTHRFISFTIIGKPNDKFKPINTKIIPPLKFNEIGSELRKHDIYITASRWEPSGNHHIEGAACGLPVLYHTDGGGINEVCQRWGEEYRDMKTLISKLVKIVQNYEHYRRKIDYGYLSDIRSSKEFLDFMV